MNSLKYKKIFVIVIDSVGVGATEDAILYGDVGSNTLEHIAKFSKSFYIPTLEKLGIGHLVDAEQIKAVKNPLAVVTKLKELSVGKDTLTGHFELMGLKVNTPFPSFTDTGFPLELIRELENYSNRKVIGNISASGTEIIKELGEEQLKTGALIVYTSADSVLQIAANEEVIPLEELYDICKFARKITIKRPEWMVGRIIARPFIGQTRDTFKRTTNRHDYAIKPFDKTVLDYLKETNYDVIAIGKINDIFDGQGITKSFSTKSNQEGMEITTSWLKRDFTGLVFVNLVDFDALYGHRRDVNGYAGALEAFDKQLNVFIDQMEDDTLLMVVADHGNDPTHSGTDHTREFVPLLIYGNKIKGQLLPLQESFACVGSTISDNFKIVKPMIGSSLLKYL